MSKKLSWRLTAALGVLVIILTAIVATPAGADFGSVRHFLRTHADPRYLNNTKTVVDSVAVPAGGFQSLQVDCPADHQATGGGVDSNDIDSQFVTSSGPVINGDRILNVANGQHGAATGWWAATANTTAGPLVMRVAVICSK
jgi:hypothetical protein